MVCKGIGSRSSNSNSIKEAIVVESEIAAAVLILQSETRVLVAAVWNIL